MTNTKQTEPETTTLTLRKSDLNYAISLLRWEWDKAEHKYTEVTRGVDVNCPHCVGRLSAYRHKEIIDAHKQFAAIDALLKRVQAATAKPAPAPAPTPEPAPAAAEPTAKKTTKVRSTK